MIVALIAQMSLIQAALSKKGEKIRVGTGGLQLQARGDGIEYGSNGALFQKASCLMFLDLAMDDGAPIRESCLCNTIPASYGCPFGRFCRVGLSAVPFPDKSTNCTNIDDITKMGWNTRAISSLLYECSIAGGRPPVPLPLRIYNLTKGALVRVAIRRARHPLRTRRHELGAHGRSQGADKAPHCLSPTPLSVLGAADGKSAHGAEETKDLP